MNAWLEQLRPVARLMPAGAKRKVKEFLARQALRRACQAIARLPEGAVPSREMLEELQRGWGNEGYAAKIEYLQEVARLAAASTRPILECGSGVTTLLVGLLAGRRGIAALSLEHIPAWGNRVSETAAGLGIPVSVRHAPLKDYGAFEWYDIASLALPEAFGLVICDGPPSATRGGRYGLLPVVDGRLARDGLILLDDADRPGETEALRKWKGEFGIDFELQPTSTTAFARARRRA